MHEPALFELAAQEAAKSDIVFLSAQGQNHLPATVHSWLKRWLDRRSGGPCALAVLVAPSTRDAPAANRMLERLRSDARAAGVDVFAHVDGAADAELERAVREIQRPAKARTAPSHELPQGPERSPYAHWGIND